MDFSKVKLKPRADPTLPLCPLSWNSQSLSWHNVVLPEGVTERPKELILLTFNIMKEQLFLAERMKALITLIEKEKPHIVALQENTNHHNLFFLECPFIRDNYYISDFTGQEEGFKCSLFCQHSLTPISLIKREAKGRPYLTYSFKFKNFSLSVSSIHLTSGNNQNTRKDQVKQIYTESLASTTDVIVMGDWNMTGGKEEEETLSQLDFVDAWLVAKKRIGKGHTFHYGNDIHINPKSTINWQAQHGPRLDRIAISSSHWKVRKVKVIGEENIADGSNTVPSGHLFISDHYGLLAKLN